MLSHTILAIFLSYLFLSFSLLRDFFVEKHWPGEAFMEIQRVVVRATCDINLPPHCCCNKSCITNVAFPFIYMYTAYRLPINLFMEYETILLDWLLEIPLITWRDDWMWDIQLLHEYMIMILSLCASEFKNKKQMKTQRECKRSQGSFLIKQRTRSAPSFDWVSGLVGTGRVNWREGDDDGWRVQKCW